MNLLNENGCIRGSFTLWDLLALTIITFVLGAWLAFERTGERGRTARCAANLRALGKAAQSFTIEHQDGLPQACVRVGDFESWDMDLSPYLDPELAKAKSVYDKQRLEADLRQYFACPSDPFQGSIHRSYAMSGRDMRYGWPPTSRDKTGVGLDWNKNTVSILNDDDLVKNAVKNHELFPRVKQSVFPDPDSTLLLTELIDPGNNLGRPGGAVIFSSGAQQKIVSGDDPHFQFGKFNYLMADGHVMLLKKGQTDGSDQMNPNVWNINPGD